jgi:outer membrane protein
LITRLNNIKVIIKTDKPIWQAGGGRFLMLLLSCTAESQGKVLPVFFVIYRGERLIVGEDGIIKAMAVDKPRFN